MRWQDGYPCDSGKSKLEICINDIGKYIEYDSKTGTLKKKIYRLYMNIPGLEQEIKILKEYLDKGWSIYYSLAKAGIKQHVHTKLLANPEYNSFIAKYRRYQRTAKIYY